MLHSHIVPGTPTTELLPTARFLTADEVRQPRRNEPCPCGSGKKYKKCCGLPHIALCNMKYSAL